MFQKPSKCFMSEEGGTPASAAAAPTPPAEPAATTPAPALDLDTIVARLSGVIDEKIAASQNATHAALRKAGVFEKAKSPNEPTTTPTQPTTSAPIAAQAGLSMADVETLLDRRGTVASRAAKYGLSDSQTKRFEAAMSNVSRESLATEADAYLNDMGLVKAAPQPATQAQATTPAPAKPNISDRGTAAPTDTRDSEGVMNSRPLEMTAHDFEALRVKYGEGKALQMFQDRVNSALRGIRIKPPSGGR